MNQGHKPKIRIFAGPNGSGKSSLKASILSILGPDLLGVYVNPDDIEKSIKTFGFLDLREFKIEAKFDEILNHFINSTLLQKTGFVDDAKKITFDDQKIYFSGIKIDSYLPSVISDFIRHKLLQQGESFSFETVMSSSDKIDFIKKANQFGYKTYLYFIATNDPGINISRVKERVSRGGHNVAEDKIVSRYYRSLDLLIGAIKNSWRAYIFDNSEIKEVLLAEAQDGKILEIKTESLPAWFNKYFFQKINRN